MPPPFNLGSLLQPPNQQSPVNLISMIAQAGVQNPESLAKLFASKGAPVPTGAGKSAGPGLAPFRFGGAQPPGVTPLPNPNLGFEAGPAPPSVSPPGAPRPILSDAPTPSAPSLSPDTPITAQPVTQPVAPLPAPIGGIAPAVIDPRTGKQFIPGQFPGPLVGSPPPPALAPGPAQAPLGANPAIIGALLQLLQGGGGAGGGGFQSLGQLIAGGGQTSR